MIKAVRHARPWIRRFVLGMKWRWKWRCTGILRKHTNFFLNPELSTTGRVAWHGVRALQA